MKYKHEVKRMKNIRSVKQTALQNGISVFV